MMDQNGLTVVEPSGLLGARTTQVTLSASRVPTFDELDCPRLLTPVEEAAMPQWWMRDAGRIKETKQEQSPNNPLSLTRGRSVEKGNVNYFRPLMSWRMRDIAVSLQVAMTIAVIGREQLRRKGALVVPADRRTLSAAGSS